MTNQQTLKVLTTKIPEPTHRQLKIQAIGLGLTLHDYCAQVLGQAVATPVEPSRAKPSRPKFSKPSPEPELAPTPKDPPSEPYTGIPYSPTGTIDVDPFA